MNLFENQTQSDLQVFIDVPERQNKVAERPVYPYLFGLPHRTRDLTPVFPIWFQLTLV